jgi:hypothetical protein
MNAFFRSTLLAAIFVLPMVAFAQSSVPLDATPVEMLAYENIRPDSASAQIHVAPANDHAGARAGILSDAEFNPAADAGLKSIYVRH